MSTFNPEEILTFVRARLNDEERIALAAAGGGQWRYEGGDSVGAWTLYDEHWNIASLTTYDTEAYNYAERMPAARNPAYVDPDANGRHIVYHDPTRVLTKIGVERRELDEVESMLGGDPYQEGRHAVNLLRLRALPYAECEGYRSEWAP